MWELTQRGAYDMSSSGWCSGAGVGGALLSPVTSEGEQRRAELRAVGEFPCSAEFSRKHLFPIPPRSFGLACIVSTSLVSV